MWPLPPYKLIGHEPQKRKARQGSVSSDLSWSEQVNVTVNKANKRLGLVHRIVGSSNPSTFSTVYKSLVRPVLEYAAPVWNPHE